MAMRTLSVILAYGMLVVPALGLKFNFTQVQQCGQVITGFSGAQISKVPTSLSILPLNSSAFFIPLQNPAQFSTGISISPLPLAAGSNFLASLDDAEGDNLINISDLIRVLPSDDSSCLPSAQINAPRRFSIGPRVSQCEELSINYDTSAVSKAPDVRIYTPKGVSFQLQRTSDDPASGTATYMMKALRGVEIVLLMDNGSNIRETSPLLTVGGDAASDNSCFKRGTATTSKGTVTSTVIANEMMATGGAKDASDGDLADRPVLSKVAIIGSAAGGAAVFLIAIAMAIFVIVDRRRRKRLHDEAIPSVMEKGVYDDKPRPGHGTSPRPAMPRKLNLVANPIYTTNSFLSFGERSKGTRGSMASWKQAIPDDQRYPTSATASPIPSSRIVVFSPRSSPRPSPRSSTRSDRQSLESLDIEGMLNMATLQSENNPGSRKPSNASMLGPMVRTPMLTTPSPTFRAENSRRQLRNIPTDVPTAPSSMTFSGYSVNPFDSQDVIYQEGPLRTGDSFRPPSGILPRSPQDPASRVRGMSGRSSSDWYGIAR